MSLNKKCSVIFLKKFNREIYRIIYYIKHKLKNSYAAKDLYKKIYDEINKRSYNPEIYEKYKSRNGKKIWFRIYIKNYIVFYTVERKNMIVSRIIYRKRNLKEKF